jgi:hypothetical protein
LFAVLAFEAGIQPRQVRDCVELFVREVHQVVFKGAIVFDTRPAQVVIVTYFFIVGSAPEFIQGGGI